MKELVLTFTWYSNLDLSLAPFFTCWEVDLSLSVVYNGEALMTKLFLKDFNKNYNDIFLCQGKLTEGGE